MAFHFPDRSSWTTHPSYLGLRPSHHRKNQENILQIEVRENVARFITEIRKVGDTFSETKSRTIRLSDYKVQWKTQESLDKVPILQRKLSKIQDLSKVIYIEKVTEYKILYNSLLSRTTTQEFKFAFLSLVNYLLLNFEFGIVCFMDQHVKQSKDLLDDLEKACQSLYALDLLNNDPEVFFNYANTYILTLGKKLSLLYPRNDVLELIFSDIIKKFVTIQTSFQDRQRDSDVFNYLQLSLQQLNNGISEAIHKSSETLRRDLSLLTEPKKGIVLSIPVGVNLLYVDSGIVDDPITYPIQERKKYTLDQIISKDLLLTEEAFNQKLEMIVNTTLFDTLVNEKILSENEKTDLLKGWKELSDCSKQFLFILKRELSSNKISALLQAFSPQNIENYMEQYKFIVCHFIPTNKILQKIKTSEHGQQLLQEFKAMHAVHLTDIWGMPMQRPPRYKGILSEIVKNLEEDDIREALSERLEYLTKWVDAINYFFPEYSNF